jgi:ABC-type bacteriocin/lantibiotic exporter with double-glycine peptidase domain
MIQTFSDIFKLLSKPEKRKYLLLGLANAMTTLLDLAGVLLSGLAGVIAYSYFSSAPIPLLVARMISKTPLVNLNLKNQLIVTGSLIIVLFVIKSIFSLVLTYNNLRFLRLLALSHSLKVYRNFAKIKYYEVKKISRDSFNFALTDGVLQIFIGMLGGYITVFAEVIFLTMAFVVMIIIDPILAVVLIGVFGLLLSLSNKLVSSRIIASGNENVIRSIEGKRITSETKLLFRELNLGGGFLGFMEEYKSNRSNASKAVMKMNFLQLFPKYFLEFVTVISGVVLLLGNSGNAGASLAAGKISIYVAALIRLIPSLLRIQTALASIQSGLGGIRTTLSVFETSLNPEVSSPKIDSGFSSQRSTGLVVRNLSFKFPDEDKFLFEGINLDLAQNSMTALVGRSGSGKSTLFDLILGFTEPSGGEILMDGIPVLKYITENPGAVALIPQEIVLMDGTLAQNIALGVSSDDIDYNRIGIAIRGAMLEDLIESLPLGVQTQVEENGVRFSGGQRQRIVIARALYSAPKFIFLDEPTSALDEETEKSFVSLLQILKRTSTLLVISHRKASMTIADKCYLLENGKLNDLEMANSGLLVIKSLEDLNDVF